MADANPDLERDKRIENAIKDVAEGSSIRKAAGKWGVPEVPCKISAVDGQNE